MATLYLDPATGAPAMPWRMVSGKEELAQRLRLRLSTERGSWFLDTAVGLPYAEWLEAATPDLRAMQETMSALVAATPGVARIEDVRMDFDRASQVAEYAATVRPTATVLGVDPDATLVVGASVTSTGEVLRAYVRTGGI